MDRKSRTVAAFTIGVSMLLVTGCSISSNSTQNTTSVSNSVNTTANRVTSRDTSSGVSQTGQPLTLTIRACPESINGQLSEINEYGIETPGRSEASRPPSPFRTGLDRFPVIRLKPPCSIRSLFVSGFGFTSPDYPASND